MIIIIATIILSVVQGIAEFLPISSSLHTSIVSLLFKQDVNLIIIGAEMGACLATLIYFAKTILRNFTEITAKVFVGSLPLAIFVLIFSMPKNALIFAPITLIIGGFIMLWCERIYKPSKNEVSYLHAFYIGIAQILAIIPGVSRSGATIVTGLFLGVERKKVVEFAFILSLPAAFASVFLSLWKQKDGIVISDLFYPLLAIGITFFVATAVIKPILNFLSTHKLNIFAIYRIILGLILIGVISYIVITDGIDRHCDGTDPTCHEVDSH